MEVAGPLGTPLGLAQRKRASPRGEAGTSSLVAQSVKNLPAMQETWIPFLGWEDPLEKEMATHSSILAWRIPWSEEPGRTEEPGRLQSMGSRESTRLND